MPVLAQATARSAHAQCKENWDTVTVYKTVIVKYTDLDGWVKSTYFGDLRTADLYTQLVQSAWDGIDKASVLEDEDLKKVCFFEILRLLRGEVTKHGKDFFPRDLKTAINEIEHVDVARTLLQSVKLRVTPVKSTSYNYIGSCLGDSK